MAKTLFAFLKKIFSVCVFLSVSVAKSKILFIAHRIPYPPKKGDKIRSFNEIKHLSKKYDIDLACLADDANDIKSQAKLERYCRHVHVEPLNKTVSKIKGLLLLLKGGSISVGYFYNQQIQIVVDQWLSENTYEAIFCFSSPMAEYIFQSKAPSLHASMRPSLLMDFCDLDSDKWGQYAQRSRLPLNLIYQLESKRLLAYEKIINQSFDHSLFVSQQEADLFVNAFPKARNLTVIPNGVDHHYFSPEHPEDSRVQDFKGSRETNQTNKPTLLFTGAMDYHANVDGVTWFCQNIFPGIKKQYPNACFYIVGSNPHPSVIALDKIDGVHVTGFVDDIRPYYQMADVCVIPLRLARGVQNKVLEAMAMAKPVVTTSAAIQGISAVDGQHLVVADNPEDFTATINDLCNDMNRRETLALAGRRFVKQHYDWDTNLDFLDGLIAGAQH